MVARGTWDLRWLAIGVLAMIPDKQQPEVSNDAADDPMADAVERLKTTQLGARQDLKVSRHLFRGEPSYIIHDPISFQSHRFSQSDYLVFSSLSKDKTLEQVFGELLAAEKIKDDDRSFYEFVLGLQMRGLLDLPLLESHRLYQRYKAKEADKNKKSLLKLIFIKIPLFNPNEFLDNTVRFAKPLFTRPFFILWMILMAGALGVLYMRWSDFYAPFADILATRNLVILVIVMTALKFWHELGHAYACKVNGGAVPDMGAMLMAGMPMAYVDVSSSWSFASRKQRILVGLGGMYFEMIAAALFMYIWAFTGPGVVNSTAHFVVLMASFMTVMFNANPLMRYDGYYVLSDLVGIPNLRGRSTQYASGLIKQLTLGLPMQIQGKSYREMSWMLCYGIAAIIYQFWLMVTISLMIASQYFLIGMTLGAMFLFGAVVTPLKKTIKYLWFSPEVAHVRTRAVAISGLIIGGIILACTIVPVPGGVCASGQLSFEKVDVVRLPFDVYVKDLMVQPNQLVKADDVLLKVENPDVADDFALASASKAVADQMMLASVSGSPAEQKVRQFEQRKSAAQLRLVSQHFRSQTVRAEADGVVISCPSSQNVGAYLKKGTELARIGQGERIVRVVMGERKITESRPEVGDRAEVRLNSTTGNSVSLGRITRIEPAGKHAVDMEGLTQAAGGNILADKDGRTEHIYFLFEIAMEEKVGIDIPQNTTASVRFSRKFESLGAYTLRHFRIFLNELVSK